jgi:hypothetical protein
LQLIEPVCHATIPAVEWMDKGTIVTTSERGGRSPVIRDRVPSWHGNVGRPTRLEA